MKISASIVALLATMLLAGSAYAQASAYDRSGAALWDNLRGALLFDDPATVKLYARTRALERRLEQLEQLEQQRLYDTYKPYSYQLRIPLFPSAPSRKSQPIYDFLYGND